MIVLCQLMAEILEAIKALLQDHGAEVLLAQDIFDFAYAPDGTSARIKQLLVDDYGYAVESIYAIQTTCYVRYRMKTGRGASYNIFEEDEFDFLRHFTSWPLFHWSPDRIYKKSYYVCMLW